MMPTNRDKQQKKCKIAKQVCVAAEHIEDHLTEVTLWSFLIPWQSVTKMVKYEFSNAFGMRDQVKADQGNFTLERLKGEMKKEKKNSENSSILTQLETDAKDNWHQTFRALSENKPPKMCSLWTSSTCWRWYIWWRVSTFVRIYHSFPRGIELTPHFCLTRNASSWWFFGRWFSENLEI